MDPSIFIRDFRQALASPLYGTFATGIQVDGDHHALEPNQPIYIDVMAGRFSLIQIALPADHARALLTALAAALPLADGTVISITEPFGPAPKSWEGVREATREALMELTKTPVVVDMKPPLVCSFCGDPHAQAKPCPSCHMPTCIFCLLSWSMRDEYPVGVAFSCRHAPKSTNGTAGSRS